MKLIDIIRLIIENKDLIVQIIEFLKEIGIIKSDGVVTLQGEVDVASVESQAVAAGVGDNAIELIKLIMANWDSIMELIKLIRG